MSYYFTHGLYSNRTPGATLRTSFYLTHYGDVNETGSVCSSLTRDAGIADAILHARASLLSRLQAEIYWRPPSTQQRSRQTGKKPEVPLFVNVPSFPAKYDFHAADRPRARDEAVRIRREKHAKIISSASRLGPRTVVVSSDEGISERSRAGPRALPIDFAR